MNCCKKTFMLALAIMLLILPGAVLAQDGAPVELTALTSYAMGLDFVVPADWPVAGEGVVQRGSNPNDATALIQQSAVGVTPDQIAASLLPRLGQAALPEDVMTLETPALTWAVYQLELAESQVGPLTFDLAFAEADLPDQQITYIMLFQASAAEYDALHEAVFLPALEAYTPFALDWAQEDGPAPIADDFAVATLVPAIIEERPHDPVAWTQGFLLYDGALYESAGEWNVSAVRELDPQTGEILRQYDVPEEFYAEGLARVDDTLIQITWQQETAFVYDIETFEVLDTYEYAGDGWGLCYDGTYLFMSDGSPYITIRDPQTFEVVSRGLVTIGGQPVDMLNELECVDESLYANIWQTDMIVQIDKTNGNVLALIDAADLLTEEQQAVLEPGREVLNGIAYDSETATFLLTGKHWPFMFQVEFVEATE